METAEPPIAGFAPPEITSFNDNWDLRSPARVFVPSAPRQRAWERRGRPTTSKAKSRTIMKRYDLRKPESDAPSATQTEATAAVVPALNTPGQATPDGKVLKKLRMRKSTTGATLGECRLRGVTARADRRGSVLPHKQVLSLVAGPTTALQDEAQAEKAPGNRGLSDGVVSDISDGLDGIAAQDYTEQERTLIAEDEADRGGEISTPTEPFETDTTTPHKQLINEISPEDLAAVTPWVELAAHADEIFQDSDVDYEQEAEHELISLTHEQREEKDKKVLEAFESAILDWHESDRDASRHSLRATASARKGRRYTEFVALMDRTYWPRERRFSMPSVSQHHNDTPSQSDVPEHVEASKRSDFQQDPSRDKASSVEAVNDISSTAPEPEELPASKPAHSEGNNRGARKHSHNKVKRRRTEGPASINLNQDAAPKRRASIAIEATAASGKQTTTTANRRSDRKGRATRRQTERGLSTEAASEQRRASTASETLAEIPTIADGRPLNSPIFQETEHPVDSTMITEHRDEHASTATTAPETAAAESVDTEGSAAETDGAKTIPQDGQLRAAEDLAQAETVNKRPEKLRAGTRRRTFAPSVERRPAPTPRKRRASTALEAVTHSKPYQRKTEEQSLPDGTVKGPGPHRRPAQSVAGQPYSKRELRSSSRRLDRRMTDGSTWDSSKSSSQDVRRASAALEALAAAVPQPELTPVVDTIDVEGRTGAESARYSDVAQVLVVQGVWEERESDGTMEIADKKASTSAVTTDVQPSESFFIEESDRPQDPESGNNDNAETDSAKPGDQSLPMTPHRPEEPSEALAPDELIAERAAAEEDLSDRQSSAPCSPSDKIGEEILGIGENETVKVATLQQPAVETSSSLPPDEAIDIPEAESMTTNLREISTTRDGNAAEDIATIKVQLNDEDTDMLKDFLNRSKANKAAKIAKRAHLDSRRDSDIIKAALASPRPALEVIDGNSPSPRKTRSSSAEPASSPMLAQSQPLPVPAADLLSANTDGLGDEDELASTEPTIDLQDDTLDLASLSGRRSGSTPKLIPNNPSSICLRRQGADGEPVALKKSEAQQLALLTRSNTRRNKGGAVSAKLMLLKLKGVAVDEVASVTDSPEVHGKVRWNEQLVAFFDENKKDGLVSLEDAAEKVEAETNNSKPRAKRSKTLGATNGTPAKPRMKDVSASVAPLELASGRKDARKPANPIDKPSVGKQKAKASSKATSLEAAAPVTSDVVTAPDLQVAESEAPARIAPADAGNITDATTALATQLPRPTKKPRGIPTPAKRQVPAAASQIASSIAQKPAAPSVPSPNQPPASAKKALPTPVPPYTGVAASGRATRKQVIAAADKENKTPDVILEAKARSVAEPPRRSVLPRRGGTR